ncbi:MAG: C_GCAxxG_C_C family protein [Clostridia bacterium]|nr:C_GCAxxG_C_C family protein [Clostridia bacterium]
MADINKVHELHGQGFNCAQVVAYFCCDISGADRKAALSAMGGFGGGLRCGEVCGAVSGGVYSLGQYCPYTDSSDIATKTKIAELTVSFTSQARAELGALACRELIPDGDHSPCEGFMARCIDLVHEIIERDKQNGNL